MVYCSTLSFEKAVYFILLILISFAGWHWRWIY